MAKLTFYNLEEDSTRLYEIMQAEGWTTYDNYDDWYQAGAEMSIFEGDPDMLKLDGETVYFWRYGDEVFYSCDYTKEKQVEGILRDFYDGGYFARSGYYAWHVPGRTPSDWCTSWDDYERLTSCIAYRGGCGYIYNFYPLRNAA